NGNGNGNQVVKGKVLDRIIHIWLENTDFDTALADPNLHALARQGLVLRNYFAVTHPSQPNYVASVGGDYFGIDSDNLFNLPSNVSSIADLLDDKGISWGEYQEAMPSTGFTGLQFLNSTGGNNYVRKHNPLVTYESINQMPSRVNHIKNFTLFEQDLAKGALPQWMFITPNMTNDGHDSSVTFAGIWARGFLEPLLENPNFNGNKTLIILTFDENRTETKPNNVLAILLGSAVPKKLIGTSDKSFYTHYSWIATAEANWNLHTLGRWDVGANVLQFVGEKTGDKIREADIQDVLLNMSYPGIFNSEHLAKQPIPNTNLVINGRTVLPAIQSQWESQVHCTAYDMQLVPPSAQSPPVLPPGC
ncbi:Acid phosphatase, partial [Termitomyces sp. J132]